MPELLDYSRVYEKQLAEDLGEAVMLNDRALESAKSFREGDKEFLLEYLEEPISSIGNYCVVIEKNGESTSKRNCSPTSFSERIVFDDKSQEFSVVRIGLGKS
jgi:hypothetical protein